MRHNETIINQKLKAMKTLKNTMLTLIMLALTIGLAQAQDDDRYQTFLVHEDQVKPSMTDEYEKISREFVALCKQHDIKDVSWLAASTSDGRYWTVSKIDNMADLDKRPLDALRDKIGKEAFGEIFKKFDKCYDTHGSYTIVLDKELSYMPDGLSLTQEGQNYRRWHYLRITPDNRSNLAEKLKTLKELHTKKGSKVHYRIYYSGFGTMGEFAMAAVSAKDGVHYEKRSAENRELLGEEGKKAFDDLLSVVDEYEVAIGSIDPDQGYTSSEKTQ